MPNLPSTLLPSEYFKRCIHSPHALSSRLLQGANPSTFDTAFLTVSNSTSNWAGLQHNPQYQEGTSSPLVVVPSLDPVTQDIQQFWFDCNTWSNSKY